MKQKSLKIIVAACFTIGMAVSTAQATTITSENFDLGATGWSNNTTTASQGNGIGTGAQFFGRFLNQTVSKTFATGSSHNNVTISFDFYEIDSWDFETFTLDVDGNTEIMDVFAHRIDDNPAQAVKTSGANGSLAYNPTQNDQTFHYSIIVPHTASTLTLAFSTNLNGNGQGLSGGLGDESWGMDNLLITDDSVTNPNPNPVSEPSTIILLSIGLMGLLARGRKYLAT